MRNRRSILQIIKLKDNRKRELEMEVKYALDRLDAEEARLLSLQKDYNDSVSRFESQVARGLLDPARITAYYEYFAQMRERIAYQKLVREQRKTELENVKDALVTAHKEKRALEILDEKTVRRERIEQERKEQKETDYNTLARRMR
jgi:flagellar export protein FliJ